MGLFGKILKTTINIATAPIAVAADVVTMGGILTDKKKTYTETQVKEIAKNVGEVIDEVEDL